jgi:hypothetical protein
MAFARGARTGVITILAPSAAKTASPLELYEAGEQRDDRAVGPDELGSGELAAKYGSWWRSTRISASFSTSPIRLMRANPSAP